MITWLVIIPPMLVLLLAALTKKVLPSLIVGIITAAIIAGQFSLQNSLYILTTRIIDQVDASNIYTLAFLIILGILITLITVSGGTMAYGRLIGSRLGSAKSVEKASIFLSFCFCIDDFFSTLAVGYIIRPLSDRFAIPRAKIAFLIDSLAAPLVVLIPVSTWIAMILMQLNKAGISLDKTENPLIIADPFAIYISVIPFIFYSFIIIASVLFIVFKGISFGPMHKQEIIARNTGNLFGGNIALVNQETSSLISEKVGSLSSFIVPLGSLFLFVFLSILFYGNAILLGGNNSFLQALQTADIFKALFTGSVLALTISLIFLLTQKKIAFEDLPSITKEGFSIMKDSLIILLLAWTFSSLLKNDLKTGEYIASFLTGTIPAFLLPCLFFIISFVTATATGSSWGTFAVMLPLAIPMLPSFFGVATPTLPESIPLLLPTIGAIFAGAVAGDHLSPLGTTTIMSTTSSQCYHNDHVVTQFAYAWPALVATAFAYIIAGILLLQGISFTWLIALSITILITIICLYLLNKFTKKITYHA